MKLSRTVSYAVKAMVALATAPREAPVCCKQLAEGGDMPERFLLQILRTLVTHDLLQSVRGVYGGYRLSRDPEDITLLEIVEAIDGPLSLHLPDESHNDSAIERSLSDLSGRLREDFADVKLSDLMPSENHDPNLEGAVHPEHEAPGASHLAGHSEMVTA